jgi:hypothetical protein
MPKSRDDGEQERSRVLSVLARGGDCDSSGGVRHLARDSEDTIRARLNARPGRFGVEVVSAEDGD